MAEAAVERAAHLTGNAKRPPVRVRDEYHFIILAVVRTQQPFARAVRGNLRFHDLRPSHDEPFGHPAPHWLGQISHMGEIDRKSVVSGKSVSIRVELGGRRIIKKKKHRLKKEYGTRGITQDRRIIQIT